MFTEISEILHRSRATVMEDALGVISLFVLLFVGLGVSGA